MKKLIYNILLFLFFAINSFCLDSLLHLPVSDTGVISWAAKLIFDLSGFKLVITSNLVKAFLFSVLNAFMLFTFFIVKKRLCIYIILVINYVSLFLLVFSNASSNQYFCTLLLSTPFICGFLICSQQAFKQGGFTKLIYKLLEDVTTSSHLGYSFDNLSSIFRNTVDQTNQIQGYLESFATYVTHLYFKVWIFMYVIGGGLIRFSPFIVVLVLYTEGFRFQTAYFIFNVVVYTVALVNDPLFYQLGEKYTCVRFFSLTGFNSQPRTTFNLLIALIIVGCVGICKLDLIDFFSPNIAECIDKSSIVKEVKTISRHASKIIPQLTELTGDSPDTVESSCDTSSITDSSSNDHLVSYPKVKNPRWAFETDLTCNDRVNPYLEAPFPKRAALQPFSTEKELGIIIDSQPPFIEEAGKNTDLSISKYEQRVRYLEFLIKYGLQECPESQIYFTKNSLIGITPPSQNSVDLIGIEERREIRQEALQDLRDQRAYEERKEIRQETQQNLEAQRAHEVRLKQADHTELEKQRAHESDIQQKTLDSEKPEKVTKTIGNVALAASGPSAVWLGNTILDYFGLSSILDIFGSIEDTPIEDTPIEDTSIKDTTLSKEDPKVTGGDSIEKHDPKVTGGDSIEKHEPKRSNWWWWS